MRSLLVACINVKRVRFSPRRSANLLPKRQLKVYRDSRPGKTAHAYKLIYLFYKCATILYSITKLENFRVSFALNSELCYVPHGSPPRNKFL